MNFLLLAAQLVLVAIATQDHVKGEFLSDRKYDDEILDFLLKNGKKFISFSSLDNENAFVDEELKRLVQNSKTSLQLRSRLLPTVQLKTMHQFHQDTLVLMASSKSENWKKYLDRQQRRILVVY